MANLIWDPVNNVWKGTFTISNDGTGNSNETYTIDLGDAEGPVTVTLNGIDTILYPGATNSINVTDCSSWSLSAAPDPVTEGNSVVVSLATTGVSDGTYAFSITGVQSGDIQETGGITWDAANSKYIGNFSLVNNASSITLNILDDASVDGPETLTLSLDNGESSVNVVINDPSQTWSLSAPSTVTEGDSVTITLNTTNVPDGLIPFSISGSGINDGDISHGAGQDVTWDAANSKFDGNFNLSGNTASITLNIIDDGVGTGGSETFTLSLDNGESSVNVTINDPVTVSCGSQIAAWSTGESNSITTSGILTQQDGLGNYGVQGWDAGGTLYLPELDGVGTSISAFYAINPDTNALGYFSYITNPITTDFYYEHNGVCYKGVITADGLTTPSNPQVLTIV